MSTTEVRDTAGSVSRRRRRGPARGGEVHRARRSPTPFRSLDEDGGNDGGVNKKDDDAESHASGTHSWTSSFPSLCPTDASGAPGDKYYLTYEALGDSPILMLPDENPPVNFEYKMGEFGGDAAVAAGGSADALGAAALQGEVSADAWEQKNGKI